MKKILQTNATLFIALLIPIVMILFIAGSIYLPAFFSDKEPQYDFLFATGSLVSFDEDERTEYFVDGQKLEKNVSSMPENQNRYPSPRAERPKFYRYDVSENEAVLVDFETVRQYVLDEARTSPDGFSLEREHSPVFFDVGGRRDEQFLKNGNYTKTLNMPSLSQGYYDFRFLGWIIDEESI